MSEVTARPLQITGRMPTKEDAEAMGARLPQRIEKAPYVREKLTGMIHFWQDWMETLGDVLEPCWDPPPVAPLVVPTSPMDLAHYGAKPPSSSPQPATPPESRAHATSVLPASEKSVRSPRKGTGPKGAFRPAVKDGNAG